MKALMITLLVLVALNVRGSSCYAQGNDGLLASRYPGSVTETHPGAADLTWKKIDAARGRTYYSKDPMEKVKAYYAKILGPFEEYDKDYVYNKAVIRFGEVVDIVTKRGGSIGEGGESFYGGTFAGVTITGPPINGSANYSVVKIYQVLESSYIQRFTEADGIDPAKMQKHLEDAELKQIKSKYEHLKTAYFVETKEKRKDGFPGALSMDEVIYDKYFTAPAEARKKELEDVQTKYTDAMTKMQFDEATKLGNRMVKLSGIEPDHKGDWNTAIKCLQEMEESAYLTKIVIDAHPSKWILTSPSADK
jgi:hypothetical protein